MKNSKHQVRYYWLSFQKHDFKSSLTVFFVALPLCLGVALASNAPASAGLWAGIIGGIVVTTLSRSPLSVSGPAAGLTAICAASVQDLGSFQIFAVAVALSGAVQVALGLFRLGGFTHFIPSTVIKGMLAAIGIILISKQIPMLIGYNKPDFWHNELLNILTFNHAFAQIENLLQSITPGAIICALVAAASLRLWKQKQRKIGLGGVPASFVAVLTGSLAALGLGLIHPALQLTSGQYVFIPGDLVNAIQLPDFSSAWAHKEIWETAVTIALVASLETLLSVEAIDKLDPYNRITPQNRELMAQGVGNMVSGLVGGLPITAVIVRSSANAEAGAKTKLSSLLHGVWLLLAVLFAGALISYIPYAVLAVILIRTGYNLAKPSMIRAVYQQGHEQFYPFIVTVGAILFTDLLIGVLIGIGYSIYFLIKHTYRAGFSVHESIDGHTPHYTIRMAMNVSFLNKKKLIETLDRIPEYSIVEIIGSNSVYIDHDILEIVQQYKAKAHQKHIQLVLMDISEVKVLEVH